MIMDVIMRMRKNFNEIILKVKKVFTKFSYQNLKASKVKVKKENKLSDKFRIRMMLLLLLLFRFFSQLLLC